MDQGAANAGALLHAARELPGKLALVAAQAHAAQQVDGAGFKFGAFFFELAAVGFDNFQRQQHVVQGGAPRQQRWRLKRHATDLERTVDHLPTHMDAALGGAAQTRGELHESGFAATRRSHDGDELALFDLEVDVFDRKVVLRQQLVVVGQPNVLKVDEVFGSSSHEFGCLFFRQDVEVFGAGQKAAVPNRIGVDA